MSEERRTVVVMFAQVTGLADIPDAEHSQLTASAFAHLRPILEARGGSVDKFIGDVVMALWGAPVAHEDDAARAARAAVEMISATVSFGAESGHRLSLRAGLNLGEVLFGAVGGDRATAMGDPVNVAHRLMTAAEPGTVLLTRAVSDAAAESIPLRKREAMTLKGRAESVEVYEGTASPEVLTTVRARATLATPILGRDEDIRSLVTRLLPAAEGHPTFVVLCGEPGVGKSRLAAEARRRLRGGQPPFRSWVGHSSEDARLPLMAAGEILVEALGARRETFAGRIQAALAGTVPRAAERRTLAGLILESLGMESADNPSSGMDPGHVEAETGRAWTLALGSLADQGPAVLVFEDVHFADPGTLGLLSRLRDGLAGRRVALLATSRVASAAPEGWPVQVVGGITREALAGVASLTLGAPPAPALADFLFEKAEGNPLFAQEMARYLRENSLVSGNPCTLSVPPARLPDRLTSLLTARLDGLPAAAKAAVKAAAVVGRNFGAGMLHRVTGRDPADALQDASARRIVEKTGARTPIGEDEWSFQHALVRDAAYQLLTRRERRTLHESIAADLTPAADADPRRIGPLAAAHREAAGQPDQAARHWIAAAWSAIQHHAWVESLAAARESVRLGSTEGRLAAADSLTILGRMGEAEAECEALLNDDATPPELRARTLLSHAKTLERMGRPDAALSAAREAERLASAPNLRAQAIRSQASALATLARPQEALERADAAAALAGATPDLLRERSYCLASLGRFEEAERTLRACLTDAEAHGDAWAGAMGSNTMGLVLLRSRRFEDAIPWFERAREAFGDSADRAAWATATHNLGLALSRCGRREEAETPIREALAIRMEVGDLRGVASSSGLLADLASYRGDLATALRLESEIVETARGLRDRGLELGALTQIGSAHYMQGRWEPALEAYERAFDLAVALGDPDSVAGSAANLGMVLILLGDGAGARDCFEKAIRHRMTLGHTPRVDSLRLQLADAWHLQGSLAEAHRTLKPLLAGDRISPSEVCGARAASARLFSLEGRRGEATAAARQVAQELNGDTGHPLNVLLDLGICHARLGDDQAARPWLERARASSLERGGEGVRLRATLELAGLSLRGGSCEEARLLASEAREASRQAGDRNVEQLSLLILARVLARSGRVTEGVRVLGEARAVPGLRHADAGPRIEALIALSQAEEDLGEPEAARASAAAALQAAGGTEFAGTWLPGPG